MIKPNTELVILAVLGRRGAGKSTICRLVENEFNSHTTGLADPLKELALRVFDFKREQVFGDTFSKERVDPRYGVSPRVMLQRLGNEARHVLGNNVWVTPTLNTVDNLWVNAFEDKVLVAIDSVRYPSEVAEITNLETNGRMMADTVEVRTIKLSAVNRPSTGDAAVDHHESEEAVDLVRDDYIHAHFINDYSASYGVLEGDVRTWLKEELKEWLL